MRSKVFALSSKHSTPDEQIAWDCKLKKKKKVSLIHISYSLKHTKSLHRACYTSYSLQYTKGLYMGPHG